MYIFYDFETSSRELIGQILTYAFVVTDVQFNIKSELKGSIQLNRTQLPEIDAILTNKIDVLALQKEGDPEHQAAEKIYAFLRQTVDQYRSCILTGYNANNFDLSFLRNLLIRYGYNPYFEGRLTNLDILHYAQHLAFSHPDEFVWTEMPNHEGKPYYSFKLEILAKSFGLLHEDQKHTAYDDTMLLIALVQCFQTRFNVRLADFQPVVIPPNFDFQGLTETAKQKVQDYGDLPNSPQRFVYRYWLKICAGRKEKIVLDLKKYNASLQTATGPLEEQGLLSCLRYINTNKHFFILEPLNQEERARFEATIQQIVSTPFFSQLNSERYFQLTQKAWDIEYQIHDMGFERIDTLREFIARLISKPDTYPELLNQLMQMKQKQTDPKQSQKDTYLIQLFNRAYLNTHPNPKPDYLARYLAPRYVTGVMLRNKESLVPLSDYEQRLDSILASPDYGYEDKMILLSLKAYYLSFKDMF